MRVIQEAAEQKALFHHWSERYWTVGESPLVGGYSAGQMSQTVGIVEYEDGTVHEHLPQEIRFVDGEARDASSSYTVTDAVKILRHELLQDPELRKGFLASIESALKDAPADIGLYDMAEKILERITG